MTLDPKQFGPAHGVRAGIRWHTGEGSVPFRLAHFLSKVIATTVFDLKIWGADQFPRQGGVLLLSNHQSMLDPVILGVSVPRPLSYMAKSELFKNPLFTKLIRSLGAFPIRQGGSAAGAIKETIERLQQGRALNIFPEGTRTEDGRISPLQNGVALVIRKAKVPVIPAAIFGSFEAYPTGSKFPWPKPIRVMFGKPILFRDESAGQIVATIDAEIRRLFGELKAMDPLADERAKWAMARVRRERREKQR
jgi:1-acyl-sn-glycerol-3-phosphate acyltransferase